MEGKEFNKNEDEELNPNSKNEDSSDSDNFGLPDYSDSEDISSEEKIEEDYSVEEPYSTEEKTEEDYSVGEPYSSDTWDTEDKEEKEEDYSYSTDDDLSADSESDSNSYSTDEYDSSENDYNETESSSEDDYSKDDIIANASQEDYEERRSPVGWIILVIIILIGLGIGLFWWFNRDVPEPVVVKKPQPVKVEKPVVTEPVTTTEADQSDDLAVTSSSSGSLIKGQIIDISEATGQYYVIVSSAIDDDLLRDYANRLITSGHGCAILAPRGNTKFSRLAVAGFESLNDAALKSEELKSEFGEKVWVKRY